MYSTAIRVVLQGLETEKATLERRLERILTEVQQYEQAVIKMDENVFLLHCQEAISLTELENLQRIPKNFRAKATAHLFYKFEAKVGVVEKKIAFLDASIKAFTCYQETPITQAMIPEYQVNIHR